MELTYDEAHDIAQSPASAIALALVLLDRIAHALEDLADSSTEKKVEIPS